MRILIAVATLIVVAAAWIEIPTIMATHRITTPSDRSSDDGGWWGIRQREKRALVQQGGWDLVFIGDSITQGWEGPGGPIWNQYYQPRKALNLGYSGDRIEHALWRLENGELHGPPPKLVVILIGTNNTGFRLDPPASIAAGIERMVSKIGASWPSTKVLILGILPRGVEAADPRRINNAKTNKLLAQSADGRLVFFLDIGDRFVGSDGKISQEVMPDFLHLGSNGYQIWAEAMEPTLRQLLGEERSASANTPNE